jgi:hypothetical protein
MISQNNTKLTWNNDFYYFLLLASQCESVMTRHANKNEYKCPKTTFVRFYLNFISFSPHFVHIILPKSYKDD